MRSFARFWLVLGVLLTFSFGLLLQRSWRSMSNTTAWLAVSKPIFAVQTNAQGVHPIIGFSVSNAGPEALRFYLEWLECRNRSDHKLLNVNVMPPGRAKKATVLPPDAATNVFVEVLTDTLPDGAPLFCCQLTWIEMESRLYHFATQIDGAMYWVANIIGCNWDPPWRHKRFTGGDVFTSNVGAAEYFSQAYGFTHAQWLAEQRLVPQMVDALGQSQPRGRVIINRHAPRNAEEEVQNDAKTAFAVFCNTATNLAGNGQSDTAPNGGTGTGSAGSGVLEGRHR